jgi:predicted nucleic acid-binding protein
MICVDASVAAKWILADEDYAIQADALYMATVDAFEPIVAPPLLPIEVTNILRRRLRAQPPLPRSEAIRLLEHFLALPALTLTAPEGLYRRALELADDHGLPAAYDAHYVALAEYFGCQLWTADERLLRQLGGRLPFVRWIGDYAPS